MNRLMLLPAAALLAALTARPSAAQEGPSVRLSGEVRAEASWAPENTASVFSGLSPYEEMVAAGVLDGKIAFSRRYTTLGLLDFTFCDQNLLAHLDGAGLEVLSFTVNELYADVNYSDLLFLRLGKQRLKWGAGFIFNPSDPVNPPKDPTEALAVREGVNALKVELITQAASLMAFGVWHDELQETGVGGRLSTSALPNTDLAVSGYWSAGQSWTAALNASIAPLYALPGWDTLQLWFEGSLYDRGRYASFAEGILPGTVTTGEAKGLQYCLLAGATAQLPLLRTVLLTEYYHLSEGLSAGELAAVYRALGSSDASVVAESSAWFAELATRPGRQGADYLFLSLSQPSITDNGHPVFDKIGFQATCLLSLTDLSFYLISTLSTRFVEDSSVELSAAWAHGAAETEFGNSPAGLIATLTVRVFF